MDASSEISPPDGGEFREFLLFSEDFSGLRALVPHGFVTHFLCTDGAMSFLHRQTRYHVAPGDYAILPHPALAGLPFILETPNELDGYAREIATMRGLADRAETRAAEGTR